MSVQIVYPAAGIHQPERCQVLVNGRPLFKDKRLIKRGKKEVEKEGILLEPARAYGIFLKTIRDICEQGRSECIIGPPAVRIKWILYEDQRIQLLFLPKSSAKAYTALKEEWTDLPRFTIDIFSGTERCANEKWKHWSASSEAALLKTQRADAEKAYWAWVQKRRNEFEVSDDKRPTQGAGRRDVDRTEEC